jgi:hypothetical protein
LPLKGKAQNGMPFKKYPEPFRASSHFFFHLSAGLPVIFKVSGVGLYFTL